MPELHAASVHAAAERIRGAVVPTPLRHSPALSRIAGAEVLLKLESEQVTGSFKIRGAYNVLASLPPEVAARGVVAASAGNHGMGVAKAAGMLGIAATIFVPRAAPRVKREGIAALGASVDDTAEHFDDARRRAEEAARASGATFVHPCEGAVLLAGQGTVGLEIMAARPDIATIVVPVGGAGLVAGIASLVREEAPHVRIAGVQTEHTNTVARALEAGVPVASDNRPTIAEGLAGDTDDYALALARFAIDDMHVVTEEATASAIAWLQREEQLMVEGSGAVGVAALLGGMRVRGPAAVVITGRNIDPELHARLVAEAG